MPVRRSPKQQAIARKIYLKVGTKKTSAELKEKIYGMVTWSNSFLRNTSQSSKVPMEQRLAAQEILALRMPNMRNSKQMTFQVNNWTSKKSNKK